MRVACSRFLQYSSRFYDLDLTCWMSKYWSPSELATYPCRTVSICPWRTVSVSIFNPDEQSACILEARSERKLACKSANTETSLIHFSRSRHITVILRFHVESREVRRESYFSENKLWIVEPRYKVVSLNNDHNDYNYDKLLSCFCDDVNDCIKIFYTK